MIKGIYYTKKRCFLETDICPRYAQGLEFRQTEKKGKGGECTYSLGQMD